MFDFLLELPLLQGISRERLTSFVERYPFHFDQIEELTPIVEKGEFAEEVIYILKGEVSRHTSNDTGSLTITEEIPAPHIISPIFLFGKDRCYPFSYIAQSKVHVLRIRKEHFNQMVVEEPILFMSLMNVICSHSQFAPQILLQLPAGRFKNRFAFWMLSLTARETHRIVISSTQQELADTFGVSKLSIKNIIKELEEEGVVSYNGRTIIINDRSDLFRFVN